MANNQSEGIADEVKKYVIGVAKHQQVEVSCSAKITHKRLRNFGC